MTQSSSSGHGFFSREGASFRQDDATDGIAGGETMP